MDYIHKHVKSVLFYFGHESFFQSGHSLALVLHGPFLSLNDLDISKVNIYQVKMKFSIVKQSSSTY